MKTRADADYDESPRRRYNDWDGIYYRGADGQWHRDNVLSPTPDPRPVTHRQAERPAPVAEHVEDSSRCQQDYAPLPHWSCEEEDNLPQSFEACSPEPDPATDPAEHSAAHAVMDSSSQPYPQLPGHPAGNSTGGADTCIPPPDDGPGPARISLDNRNMAGIDSLTDVDRLYAGDMWQSVRPAYPLISGPSPPIPMAPSPPG